MKKLFLLLIFVYGVSWGQDYPGDNVELLIGKELKVKEKSEKLRSFGYDGFFTDINLKEEYLKDSKIFNTPYDVLVNKEFTVISFEKMERSGIIFYSMKIENKEIGVLYFKYQPKYEFTFQFNIIGGIQFPEGYWCKDIETSKDKFSGVIEYNSPRLQRITFIKQKGIIDIRINVPGSTLNINEKGVILLLKDGSKINRPNQKISADYNDGYRYSAYFQLTKIEIEKIIKNPITDVKLYIYDAEIFTPEKYSQYLKCLSKM